MKKVRKLSRKKIIVVTIWSGLLLTILVIGLIFLITRNNEPKSSVVTSPDWIVVPKGWEVNCQKNENMPGGFNSETCIVESMSKNETAVFQRSLGKSTNDNSCDSYGLVVEQVRMIDLEHTDKQKLAEIILYDQANNNYEPLVIAVSSSANIKPGDDRCNVYQSQSYSKQKIYAAVWGLAPNGVAGENAFKVGDRWITLMSLDDVKKAFQSEGYLIAVQIISDSLR
ncbi:hypothetical protein FWG95_03535 [Candidatus Saccharibacteria bacterium]|nr:hypothetical protein [Candidatus Saccharibacteria bacterium]